MPVTDESPDDSPPRRLRGGVAARRAPPTAVAPATAELGAEPEGGCREPPPLDAGEPALTSLLPVITVIVSVATATYSRTKWQKSRGEAP